MDAKCLIKFNHQILRDNSNRVSNSADGNGPDLLRLGLRFNLQSGLV